MRIVVTMLSAFLLIGIGSAPVGLAQPLKKKPLPRKTKPAFKRGIYYVQPALDHPGGTLRLAGGVLKRTFSFDGNTGWAINRHRLVWASGSDVHIVSPAGSVRIVHVQGLYAIGRPSLSPDGTTIAVQATETPVQASTPPQFLTVYVIKLADGTWTQLVPPSSNPRTGNELPEWDPAGGAIADQGIGDYGLPADGGGCDIFKIVDATTRAERLTIRNDGTTGCYRPARGVLDGPRFHISFTRDGRKLLSVGQMRTYDTSTGALLSDIHDKVLAALSAAGYQPDGRFPGQGGGGTFPLDGSFSPDGKAIVFDGAVQKDGSFGVLLMRINADGSGFKILAGPLTVNPQFSNNHNYSQLNPYWLP
jgi:hypothetical protein